MCVVIEVPVSMLADAAALKILFSKSVIGPLYVAILIIPAFIFVLPIPEVISLIKCSVISFSFFSDITLGIKGS